MYNKKIKNATEVTANGIAFKSRLEKTVYNTLISHNITPEYEPRTFLLWEGFRPTIPFYDQETRSQRNKRILKGKDNKGSSYSLILKKNKIAGIKYTPDFIFKYNNIDVYIEVKGFENDVFYIKKKMFIKYLDNKFIADGIPSMFFEVHTKTQILQAIEILKNHECNRENTQ